MRTCCIDDCKSRSTDIGRSLFEYCIGFRFEYCNILFVDNKNNFSPFRIHDGRKDWINIIRRHQSINESGRLLFICDLHFNPSDIQKHRTKTVLQKNAVPNIGYEFIFHRIITISNSCLIYIQIYIFWKH